MNPDSGESDIEAKVKKYLSESTSSDDENYDAKSKRTDEMNLQAEDFDINSQRGTDTPKNGALQSYSAKNVNYQSSST